MIHHGFGSIVKELGLSDMLPFGGQWTFESKEVKNRPAAERIRAILEELGPTFVKLGQMLSTRPDIIPPSVILELEKLQDHVPPFSPEEVKEIIVKNLEAPIDELFAGFEEEPLAAASIGQVHKAILHNGEEVAVKVQRPNIQGNIETDLEILHNIVRLAEKRFSWAKDYGISDIVDEFSQSLHRELDYGIEGRNAEKIASQFVGNDKIKIPSIYWEYSTKRVLTMEYVEGVKINDVDTLDELGFNRQLISERFTDAMMNQILIRGLFHADPHPGNVLIQPGDRIVFIDFGNIGYLDSRIKYAFATLIIALKKGNTDSVMRAILKLGFTPDDINYDKLRSDVEEIIDKYYGHPLNTLNMSEAVNDFFTLTYLHHIRIPSDLTMLGKTFLAVEGVVETLNPEFNIIDVIEPFGEKLIKERLKPKNLADSIWNKVVEYSDILDEMPRSLHELTNKLKEGKFSVQIRVPQLDVFLGKMDKVGNQLAYAIILLSFSIMMAGLIIGSSSRGNGSILWQLPIIEIGSIIATLMALYLLYSIFKSGRF